MALVTNKATQDWRVLVEISLTGLTLKLAEETVIMDDGSVYNGRLQDVGLIEQSAGAVLDPKVITSRNTITLDNADGQFTTYFDDYIWTNREVVIKAGQGLTIADYEEIYRGRVLTSGGVRMTEQAMTVTVDDVRSQNSRTLPVNKFFPSDYANIEDKSKYLPKPLVYGDFSSGAGPQRVPAFQTDDTVGTGGEFTWADHAVKDLESVWLDDGTGAVSVAFSSENNTTATFTLDVAYSPNTDTVTVHGKGATDDGTSSGTLLESLSDIVNDILTTHLGVAAGNIDSAAFTAWEGELTTADYGRRWIGTEISSNTLITEALVEGFADMTVRSNKYYPVYRLVPLTSLDTFREADLRNQAGGEKVFEVTQDPEENYLNTVAVDYAYNPVSGKYARYEKDYSAEITDAGIRQRRRLTLKWLYKQVGSETRGERELFNFSTITEMMGTAVGPRCLTKVPTDFFRITYSKYTDIAFQIRQITKDFSAMTARITAWNVAALVVRRWTASGEPTWLLSTQQEREENGFWTDTSGYADTTVPPDEDSKDSIWF